MIRVWVRFGMGRGLQLGLLSRLELVELGSVSLGFDLELRVRLSLEM